MRLLSHSLRLWWHLISFAFRLFYNEFAFTYDAVSVLVSLNQWRCWQRASLNHIVSTSGTMTLELAHGTGNLQLDLREARIKNIGLDLSPYMGRIARAKLIKSGSAPDLIQGKAQILPFTSGVFSNVISTFPTSFIFESTTLLEIHRVLNSEGRLIVVLNGVLTSTGFIKWFIDFLYRITGQSAGDASEIILNHIKDLFDAHGFILSVHRESCTRSYAQILVAHKKP